MTRTLTQNERYPRARFKFLCAFRVMLIFAERNRNFLLKGIEN